ncbi:MAG: hypothetical protein HY040_20445 [Planctomycetes bacterium]|nr:hypothetical protein [Planctomycetota bacterium]
MRTLLIPGVMLVSAALALFAPEDAAGQQKFGGKQGKFGGSGFTFNPLEMVSNDPGRSFDFMSRGRGIILISDMRSPDVRDALSDYAQRKGITSGQLSREQFIDFGQDVKTRLNNGTLKANPITIQPRGDGGKDGAPTPKEGSGDSVDAIKKLADDDFKRRDANGDGFLNKDEMPEALKAELSKWVKNGGNLISKEEYREYFIARVRGTQTNSEQAAPNPLVIVIDEEELDRRPTVFRAGKLPKELPTWFAQLDTDGDGQVALWEWRKGGKDLDEFQEWDRDGDGFITAEEVLHKLGLGAGSLASAKKTEDGADRPQPQSNRNGPPPNMIIVPNFSSADGNSSFMPFGNKRGGDRNGGNGDKKSGKNGGGNKGKQRPE